LLDEKQMTAMLSHRSPYVAAWSVQLLCEDQKVGDAAIQALIDVSKEQRTDAMVRLYLASALSRLPVSSRWEIAE
jgi:hypothetical protein